MLRSVRIRNFKSFSDSTFELGPLTLVLGANGAGKSNFLDALRFLGYVGEGLPVRDAIEGYASADPGQLRVSGIRGGGREVPRLDSGSSHFSVDLVVETDGDRIEYGIKVDVERHRVMAEYLRSSLHGQDYVFDTHAEPEPPAQNEESYVLMARYYRRSAGRRPQTDFDANRPILSQFRGRKANSGENEEAAQRLRDELRAITPLELRPEALRQYSPGGTHGLGEHGENFAAMVAGLLSQSRLEDLVARGRLDAVVLPEPESHTARSATDRLRAIESWLNELTPSRIGELSVEEAPTGEVIFAARTGPNDRALTARSLSDGTVRFAALAFVLFGEARRRTLLIEEIENGIHPARADLVLQMLEATAASDPQTQVICTTHSPALLKAASRKTAMDAVVVGWDADKGCSNVVAVRLLPDVLQALEDADLGELQADGWLQYAAAV